MAGKKGGLGRGLDSLFSDGILSQPASVLEPVVPAEPARSNASGASKKSGTQKTSQLSTQRKAAMSDKADNADDAAERVVYIGLNDIRPNSAQPRKNFSQDALEELAESIKTHGVIQPVLLRPSKKGYELVAGERRWRAARLAGLKSVPAIIRDLDERQNAFYALIENMQREDLNPIEEAEGIMEIIGNYGLTQEEAAKIIGKSRPYVTHSLRIAKLPEPIREMIASGQLSAGHAKAIAGLDSENLQIEAAEKAVKDGWSVRQIESYTGTKTKRRRKSTRSKTKSADIREVESDLTEALGTRVLINGTEKRGKIEIEYYSREELERLIEVLGE